MPAAAMRKPCLQLNLGRDNLSLDDVDVADPAAFQRWLDAELDAHACDWAFGGYAEDRALYAMSPVFGTGAEVRSLHLGVDLWMPAGTEVFAIGEGVVHSFADNAQAGDYGPTIILQHQQADGQQIFSLYGHLSRGSLASIKVGQQVHGGQRMGWLGTPEENLGWAPHLHLQFMLDVGDRRGDFPGVCHRTEQQMWLRNCPSPESFLRHWMGSTRLHRVG